MKWKRRSREGIFDLKLFCNVYNNSSIKKISKSWLARSRWSKGSLKIDIPIKTNMAGK